MSPADIDLASRRKKSLLDDSILENPRPMPHKRALRKFDGFKEFFVGEPPKLAYHEPPDELDGMLFRHSKQTVMLRSCTVAHVTTTNPTNFTRAMHGEPMIDALPVNQPSWL